MSEIDKLMEQVGSNKYHRPLSEYDLIHSEWGDIGFNREKLSSFLENYHWVSTQLPETQEREKMDMYRKVIARYDLQYLTDLYNGVPYACRQATIELLARQAAAEMCVLGRYEVETFKQISQLPLADYKLVVKRVQELVNIANDVTNEATKFIGIAGA